MDYDRQIQELKILRDVYKFLETYGIFEMEYEGSVQKWGDTVQMYRSRREVIVDTKLPYNPIDPVNTILRYLFDNLNWTNGGPLVIQCVNGTGFIYGYKEKG